jgi:hypothetical protein
MRSNVCGVIDHRVGVAKHVVGHTFSAAPSSKNLPVPKNSCTEPKPDMILIGLLLVCWFVCLVAVYIYLKFDAIVSSSL